MSDIISNQRVEHEGSIYHNQSVNVYETYGRWHIGRKNHRVYALGDNNWITNIQTAMLQAKMEQERSKR